MGHQQSQSRRRGLAGRAGLKRDNRPGHSGRQERQSLRRADSHAYFDCLRMPGASLTIFFTSPSPPPPNGSSGALMDTIALLISSVLCAVMPRFVASDTNLFAPACVSSLPALSAILMVAVAGNTTPACGIFDRVM